MKATTGSSRGTSNKHDMMYLSECSYHEFSISVYLSVSSVLWLTVAGDKVQTDSQLHSFPRSFESRPLMFSLSVHLYVYLVTRTNDCCQSGGHQWRTSLSSRAGLHLKVCNTAQAAVAMAGPLPGTISGVKTLGVYISAAVSSPNDQCSH